MDSRNPDETEQEVLNYRRLLRADGNAAQRPVVGVLGHVGVDEVPREKRPLAELTTANPGSGHPGRFLIKDNA